MKILAILSIVLACVLSGTALIALSWVLNGLALTYLWAWFIVPLFGAPTLSIPYAIGLSLVASFLTHQSEEQWAKDPEAKSWVPFVTVFAKPFVVLLIGWIVTLFM